MLYTCGHNTTHLYLLTEQGKRLNIGPVFRNAILIKSVHLFYSSTLFCYICGDSNWLLTRNVTFHLDLTYKFVHESNSMVQSPSCEDNIHSASQTTHLLWNLDVHYHVHKSPPPPHWSLSQARYIQVTAVCISVCPMSLTPVHSTADM
jgi:hypothetical protein